MSRWPDFDWRQDVTQLVGECFQVSRKFGHVARFPPAFANAPKLALRWGIETYDKRPLLPHVERWLGHIDTVLAGDHFLRVYAGYHADLGFVLNGHQMAEFRKAGGDTYLAYMTVGKGRPS